VKGERVGRDGSVAGEVGLVVYAKSVSEQHEQAGQRAWDMAGGVTGLTGRVTRVQAECGGEQSGKAGAESGGRPCWLAGLLACNARDSGIGGCP